jgi:peptidoglycan hydrolase FlgJ
VAINPPSDIVLGAVLAADPSKYRAAADRLRRAGTDAGTDFAASAPAPRAPAPPPGSASDWQTSVARETIPSNALGQLPASPPAATAGRAAKPPDAFAQLESFVLQSFIQTMLPKNSQSFFGKGTAGEVWKSMLAEKLGAQIASSNQIGLAKRLAAGRTNTVAPPQTAAALGVAGRMPSSLTSILPYIQRVAPADKTPSGGSAPDSERS